MTRKAYAYITREAVGASAVLCLRHRDDPEAGIQVRAARWTQAKILR